MGLKRPQCLDVRIHCQLISNAPPKARKTSIGAALGPENQKRTQPLRLLLAEQALSGESGTPASVPQPNPRARSLADCGDALVAGAVRAARAIAAPCWNSPSGQGGFGGGHGRRPRHSGILRRTHAVHLRRSSSRWRRPHQGLTCSCARGECPWGYTPSEVEQIILDSGKPAEDDAAE